MKVFVTVGTTRFDSLINTVVSEDVQKVFAEKNYTDFTLQIGNSIEPVEEKERLVNVNEIYRFKSSLETDILNCDLVISHAGAGTCLEVLGHKKPLIVVINETLMGNHQIELAQRLGNDNHLKYCTVETLAETIGNFDPKTIVPYEAGNIRIFTDFIDKLMDN